MLCLQYSDNYLVTGSSDATIIIWTIKDTLPTTSTTYNNNTPATTSNSGQSYHHTRTLAGHAESVLNLRFDGKHIISCGKDKTIRVWLFDTGECLQTLKGHRAAVNSVQFKNGIIVSASGG